MTYYLCSFVRIISGHEPFYFSAVYEVNPAEKTPVFKMLASVQTEVSGAVLTMCRVLNPEDHQAFVDCKTYRQYKI